MKETEHKFLISGIKKELPWDREQIIFQWFLESSKMGSKKIKIIFDMTRESVICVCVTKKIIKLGEAEKTVEYLLKDDIDIEKLIGIPFVLKRRSIKDKIFLDKFIRSNGIVDYLLEYEGEDIKVLEEFDIIKEVTQDISYYNQNMCDIFSADDAGYLQFILKIWINGND